MAYAFILYSKQNEALIIEYTFDTYNSSVRSLFVQWCASAAVGDGELNDGDGEKINKHTPAHQHQPMHTHKHTHT